MVVNLAVEQGNGSTLIVGGEQTLSIDDFGDMIGGIVTIEDTSEPNNLVGGVEHFQQPMNLVP